MIKVTASLTKLSVTQSEPVPTGNVRSLWVEFELLDGWEGLTPTAVFGNGSLVVAVPVEENRCRIPWETLSVPGELRLSLRGTGTNGVIICTENKLLGLVSRSLAASVASEESEPSPDIIDALLARVAYLEEHGTGGGAGQDGKSAYELAVEDGFSGTLSQWLDSLNGEPGTDGIDGTDGKSAYELAVEDGFSGTLSQWLDSLNGEAGTDGIDGVDGKSAYELAMEDGFSGTLSQWLDSLNGEAGTDGTDGADGKSAYELAVEDGFSGTLAQWLDSLSAAAVQSVNGKTGRDVTLGAGDIPYGIEPVNTKTYYIDLDSSVPSVCIRHNNRSGSIATAAELIADIEDPTTNVATTVHDNSGNRITGFSARYYNLTDDGIEIWFNADVTFQYASGAAICISNGTGGYMSGSIIYDGCRSLTQFPLVPDNKPDPIIYVNDVLSDHEEKVDALKEYGDALDDHEARIGELEEQGGGLLIINLTESGGTYTADKTYAQALAAYNAGKQLEMRYGGVNYPLGSKSSVGLSFGNGTGLFEGALSSEAFILQTNNAVYRVEDSAQTANDGVLTIKQGGTVKGTFSANSSSDVEISLDAGGGGGDNAFVATAWISDDNTHTILWPETTYAEIAEAVSAKKNVALNLHVDDSSTYYQGTLFKSQYNGITFCVPIEPDDLYWGEHSRAYIHVSRADVWTTSYDDYATTEDLADGLADKLDKAQGVSHAGEFLVVGSNGNITTSTLAAWQGGSY